MTGEEQDPKDRPTSREILGDLMDWGEKVFQKVKVETETLSTMGKLRLDLTSLRSKRGAEFKKLGMKVYHLLEQGKIEIPDVDSNIESIEGLAEKIRDREQQLKDLGQTPSPSEEVASEGEIEENSRID